MLLLLLRCLPNVVVGWQSSTQHWHKPLFPLDATDYAGFIAAAFGLILASGGGIGGGGMLVTHVLLFCPFEAARCDPEALSFGKRNLARCQLVSH